ncbi:MAG TPA: hypothetical protein PLR65_05900 [Anaerolineales bacterium]|nr:hypothetical protein [Anaerolineales bacterium]
MNVWLSPEILDRPRDPLFHQATPNEDVFFKPYELLKHAQKRIFEVDDKGTSGEEAFALGEAVAHLRGAIEHRQKQIVKKFNLSKLSVDGWPVGRDHDKLSELHVMRPLLVKKLIDLRNFVIHEQKYPHNDEKHSINELFEFTWYFIRTTYSFLSR